MILQTTSELFRVKDLLVQLINFMQYFPHSYALELAVNYKFQEKLLRGLAIFLKEVAEDWKLEHYAKCFEWHI